MNESAELIIAFIAQKALAYFLRTPQLLSSITSRSHCPFRGRLPRTLAALGRYGHRLGYQIRVAVNYGQIGAGRKRDLATYVGDRFLQSRDNTLSNWSKFLRFSDDFSFWHA